MKIHNNFSLVNHNSFGIEANAEKFISISSTQELEELISLNSKEEKIFIGGGSNILITRNIKGLVINLNMKGISSKKIDDTYTEVKINSGENWDDSVKWCLKNNLGGIENLSLIPGNTGAAPIQNIGAYGVELKDVFISCSVLDINTNKILEFKNKECKFEYRNSIFKKNKNYIVLSIKLRPANLVVNNGIGGDYFIDDFSLFSQGSAPIDFSNIDDVVDIGAYEFLDSTFSIDNIDENLKNIFLYPNPAKDLVFVYGLNSDSRIDLFDLLGNKYYVNYTYMDSKVVSINVNKLSTGYYLIRIYNTQNNSFKTMKLLKK